MILQKILQDVFVKIHRKASDLSDSDKLISWIYQITRNTIIDYYRKKKVSTSNMSFIPEELDETDVGLNPQFIKCLIPFIDQLPDIYREALNKTIYGDLSQKECAVELGITYTAFKSRVQRARQKLKSLFTQCCNIQSDKY